MKRQHLGPGAILVVFLSRRYSELIVEMKRVCKTQLLAGEPFFYYGSNRERKEEDPEDGI